MHMKLSFFLTGSKTGRTGKILLIAVVVFCCAFLACLAFFQWQKTGTLAFWTGVKGDSKTPIPVLIPGFDSLNEEISFSSFMQDHRATIKGHEHIFANPSGKPGDPRIEFNRDLWKEIRKEMERKGDTILGKKFFKVFIQCHQDMVDAQLKFLAMDYDGAMALLRKAKTSAKKLKKIPMQNRQNVPRLFVDQMSLQASICMGATECMRGNLKKGLAMLRSAYDEANKAGWRKGKAQAAHFMALQAQRAQAPYARTLFEQALKVAQQNKAPDQVWRCHYALAGMDMGIGRIDEAIKNLQEAVIVIEAMRTKLEDDLNKTTCAYPIDSTYHYV